MRLHGSNILTREQIDQLIARGLNVVWFPRRDGLSLLIVNNIKLKLHMSFAFVLPLS